MSRPVCAHCGAPYGQRHTSTEQVTWPLDGERPVYRGNGVLIKESEPYKTTNRDTVRAVTMLSVNPDIRADQEAAIARAPEKSRWVLTRTIWDGESWRGGYDPFCTLRCALDYARKSYKSTKRRR